MDDIANKYDEVPHPVLLNCWKHHAGALRQRINDTVRGGATALDELPTELVVIGSELMDLYVGVLTPNEIAAAVLNLLTTDGLLPISAYRRWVEESGGYRVLTLQDDSQWVLRMGEEAGRYVHVHPARWAPQTQRVRANVLKTAIMVVAYACVQGGDPLDKQLVNLVRHQFLGLSPIGKLEDGQGLATVIELLASVEGLPISR